MRRSRIATTVVVALVLGSLAGCTSSTSAGGADPSPTSGASGTSLLFSLSAQGGTFGANTAGDYTLTLDGADDHMIAFADRPNRSAAVIDTRAFIASWDESFAGDAPNAVLVEHRGGDEADSTVMVLTDPRLDGNTLTFTARVIQGETPDRLAGTVDTLHADVPATFRDASLFIDDLNTQPANSDYDFTDHDKGFPDSHQE